MKIAYIVSLFPCLSETFIQREIEELTNLGHEITIFSLKHVNNKDVNHYSVRKFKRIIRYPNAIFGFFNFFFFMIFHPIKLLKIINTQVKYNKSDVTLMLKSLYVIPRVLRFKSIIKGKKIQHIHAHWATIPTTAAWMIHYTTEIPYSFTAHAWDIWKNTEMLSKKIIDSKFTATISNFNKELMSKDLPAHSVDKIKIVHCGIDVDQFTYNMPKKFTRLKILSIGRFVEKKGFPYLLDACQQLLADEVSFELTIVGHGPMWEEISNLIETYKLENHVFLTGAMPQEKLRTKFLASDLFVLPAIKAPDGDLDGIPVVLMEAMALGIPVISTKISGIPELIENDVNGILIEEKNIEQLVDAIKKMAEFSDKHKDYSQNARLKIENEFNIKKSAKQMAELIER
ncbi:MAG: glycosyltransferase [Candidatus Marinimicrobia bacterium]|nr:glycosyltransferase [Candidatus Neomarinimicrobiota bacterium]